VGAQEHAALIAIPARPATTQVSETISVDLLLPGLDGQLHGGAVTVSFLEQLRRDACFGSGEEAARQLNRDIAAAFQILGQ
jgi:FAD synthase